MSVFRHFQSAWALRFPNCELPNAWAEDVRGNLDKHRLRLAVLKEELEKEEFYVEYLERLLADAERGRTNSSSSSSSHNVNNTNGLIPKASPRTSTANNSNNVNNNNSTNNNNNNTNNNQMQQQTQQQHLHHLHQTTTTTPTSANRDNSRNGSNSDNSHGACNTSGDQYVTVISVSSGEERGKESSDSSTHLKRQSSSLRGNRVSYY